MVLPGLEADAPGAGAALARSAAQLGADDAELDRLAGSAPLRWQAGAVLVPAGILATTPRPVAARIVRRALRLVHPPHPGSASDVAGVMAALTGSTAQLSAGLLATREGAFVAIHHAEATVAPGDAGAQPLAVPGRVTTAAGMVSATNVDLPAALHAEPPSPGSAPTWAGSWSPAPFPATVSIWVDGPAR